MVARPFPVDEERTGIALAYKNEEMIADRVLPVTTPVSRAEFSYNEFPIEEALTVPNTDMGRRSEANTIELTAKKTPSSTEDKGLSDLVPNDDISNATEGYDPLNHATETTTDLMILDREVRVANLVFNPVIYPAANKVQLAGASQWNAEGTANPFLAIWRALAIPLVRPNLGILGEDVWTELAIHPKMIAGVYGSASTAGVVLIEDLARRLKLKEILVGGARVNSARKGQAVQVNRAWGRHAAFIHSNPLANNERGMTFGMTVPKGRLRQVSIIDEPKIGVGGSQRVQVESQIKELITAPGLGCFFQDAVAPVA
jgi:hypothetical protein